MKAALLDVNVLLALVWDGHVHHGNAHQWFRAQGTRAWATCAITQLGLVRLLSNPRITAASVTPLDAVEVLRRLVAAKGHQYWDDAPAVTSLAAFSHVGLVGHRQVTDAYLLSLAALRKGALVTFDQGLAAFARAGKVGQVELIG